MMKKFAACAVLATSAVAIASATAYADPAAPAPAADGMVHVPASQALDINGVHYTVTADGKSVVLTSDGSFQSVNGSLVVDNAQGDAVDSIPLSYRKNATAFPIAAEIGDHTVRLTPSTDPAAGQTVDNPITPDALAKGVDATAQPITESFTPRDQQELSAFGSRATISSATGAVIGGLVGGTVGCLAGAVVGSVSTAITTLLAGVVPGALVGCIAGVATVGAVGTLAGAALVAGPIMLWSAYQYFDTINSPCHGPGTYCVDPNAPAPVPAH
jgi:hypothetical protein